MKFSAMVQQFLHCTGLQRDTSQSKGGAVVLCFTFWPIFSELWVIKSIFLFLHIPCLQAFIFADKITNLCLLDL